MSNTSISVHDICKITARRGQANNHDRLTNWVSIDVYDRRGEKTEFTIFTLGDIEGAELASRIAHALNQILHMESADA